METDDEYPNYHFIEDKAYTNDDGVLVYNVYVHNVPIQTTNSEFFEYFKTFGDILSVHLYKHHVKKASQKLGFVNYKDPMSAAKALLNPFHSINKKRIQVRACYSCHQPDVTQSATKATADTEGFTNDDSVLNLNDDCLDEIFNHLEMKDQINLAQCCSRLQDVFVMRAKVEYKFLDLDKLRYLTLCQLAQFFQMVGAQIQKLTFRDPSHSYTGIIEFLRIYCLNVKSLTIHITLTETGMQNLLENMHMVEEIKVEYVDVRDCIPVFKKLKNLKILSLYGCRSITGTHIDGLTTLESLSLNRCDGILLPVFRKICKNLTDLKFLDIQSCSQIDLLDIVKYMHKLETIKLSCDNGQVDCIASLPSLKHLHLYNDKNRRDPVTSQIFDALAKQRADQLETLEVRGYNNINYEKTLSIAKLRKLKELICPNNVELDDNCLSNISQLQELELLNISRCRFFTAKGLLHLIQKCPKLSTLNVSYCKRLNDEFAIQLLQLLISEKKQRDQQKPLKIMAYSTEMGFNAANTTAFKSDTDLLSISHKYPKNQASYLDLIDSDIL